MDALQKIVEGWLLDLGKALGRPLPLSADGVCRLDHPNAPTLILEVPAASSMLYYSSPLLKMEQGASELDLCKRALSLNLFQVETAGATLALDEKIGEIVMCLVHPIEGMTSVRFQSVLNNFLATAIGLREKLQEERAKAVASRRPDGNRITI